MSKAQNLPSARKCPARLLGSGVYFLYQLFLRIWSIWASSWIPSGLWIESDFFFFFVSGSFPPPCHWQQGDSNTPAVSQNSWEPSGPPRMLKLVIVVIYSVQLQSLLRVSWVLRPSHRTFTSLCECKVEKPPLQHCWVHCLLSHHPSGPAGEIFPTELKHSFRLFITFK